MYNPEKNEMSKFYQCKAGCLGVNDKEAAYHFQAVDYSLIKRVSVISQ